MKKEEIKRIGEIIREGRQLFSGYPVDTLICVDGFEWITAKLTEYFKEVNNGFDEEAFLGIVNS